MEQDFRNIEHPDITAAERTGYPPRRLIRKVEVEITEDAIRDYIDENEKDFIDWCFADPDIIDRYLTETDRGFRQWVRDGLAG